MNSKAANETKTITHQRKKNGNAVHDRRRRCNTPVYMLKVSMGAICSSTHVKMPKARVLLLPCSGPHYFECRAYTSRCGIYSRPQRVGISPYLTPMYSNKIKIKNKVRSQGIAMAEGISYPVYSKGTNRCSRCTVQTQPLKRLCLRFVPWAGKTHTSARAIARHSNDQESNGNHRHVSGVWCLTHFLKYLGRQSGSFQCDEASIRAGKTARGGPFGDVRPLHRPGWNVAHAGQTPSSPTLCSSHQPSAVVNLWPLTDVCVGCTGSDS